MKELKYGFRESWPTIILDAADILFECNLGNVTIGDYVQSFTNEAHHSIKLEITDFNNPKKKLAMMHFIWETFKPNFEGDPWAGTWMTVRSVFWTEPEDWEVSRTMTRLSKAFHGLTKFDASNFLSNVICDIYKGITKKSVPANLVDALAALDIVEDDEITGYCDNLNQRPLFIGAHGGWFVLTRAGRVSRAKKPNHAEFNNTPMYDLTLSNQNVCSKILSDYYGKPLIDAISELQYIAKYGFDTTVLKNPIIDNPERYAENVRFFEEFIVFPVESTRFSMETFSVQCEVNYDAFDKCKEIAKAHPMDLVNWLAPKVVGNEDVERYSGGEGIYGALFEQIWVLPYRILEIEFTAKDDLC